MSLRSGRHWDPDASGAKRGAWLSIKDNVGRGGAVLPPALGLTGPLGGAWGSWELRLQLLAARPGGGAMELEPELLLQEARENVEAAQSYRRELGQRLQGLREARRQVGGPRPEELYGRGERARCPAVGRGP